MLLTKDRYVGATEASTDKLGYRWAREGLSRAFVRFKIKK